MEFYVVEMPMYIYAYIYVCISIICGIQLKACNVFIIISKLYSPTLHSESYGPNVHSLYKIFYSKLTKEEHVVEHFLFVCQCLLKQYCFKVLQTTIKDKKFWYQFCIHIHTLSFIIFKTASNLKTLSFFTQNWCRC